MTNNKQNHGIRLLPGETGLPVVGEDQENASQKSDDRDRPIQVTVSTLPDPSNTRIARFTGWLVLISAIAGFINIWQASVSSESADVAMQAATISQKLGRDNVRIAELARSDAKISSDAAIKQSAQSLAATIDNFHVQQRAWVTASDISIDKLKAGSNLGGTVEIKNTGVTPAFNLRSIVNNCTAPVAESMKCIHYPNIDQLYVDGSKSIISPNGTFQSEVMPVLSEGTDRPLSVGILTIEALRSKSLLK